MKKCKATEKLTLGDGNMENDDMMRSGYSSRIFAMSNVPIPEPVPPPREWVSWKPYKKIFHYNNSEQ